MQQLEKNISCPYCGQTILVLVDDSVEQQDYYEDCSVCCRPIRMCQSTGMDGKVYLNIMRDDE